MELMASASGPIPIEENASFQDLNGTVWQNTRAAKFNILICLIAPKKSLILF